MLSLNPSSNEVTSTLLAKLGGLFPRGIVTLIAKCAMERFDDIIFGPERWMLHYGATPVTLPSIEELRQRATRLITATGKKPEKALEEMSAVECANFVGELGKEEYPEPPVSLYECLNTPIRVGENLAGFTCTVTFIPQYVRQKDRVLTVTSQTLAEELGPNPLQGHPAKLANPDHALKRSLTPKAAQETQPSCYFVMEREPAPDAQSQTLCELITQIGQQGDTGWQLPEPRNFIASVFTRRVWTGEFLFGKPTYTYGNGRSRNGYFLHLGCFDEHGLVINFIYYEGRGGTCTSASRSFIPLVTGNLKT